MRDVNLPANFVPIEGDKILRVFDYFNLPDELVELIPGQSFAHLGARADYVRHETTVRRLIDHSIVQKEQTSG